MSGYTKIKDKVHYCPRCGADARKSIEIISIDLRLRKLGSEYGFPYWGSYIRCTKCDWSGRWFIPDDKIRKKLEQQSNKVENKKVSHVKKTQFR
jgi:hypothetical protein